MGGGVSFFLQERLRNPIYLWGGSFCPRERDYIFKQLSEYIQREEEEEEGILPIYLHVGFE